VLLFDEKLMFTIPSGTFIATISATAYSPNAFKSFKVYWFCPADSNVNTSLALTVTAFSPSAVFTITVIFELATSK
jgi:hypothetical protein